MLLNSFELRQTLYEFEKNTSNLSGEQKILAEQTKNALASIAKVVDDLAKNFRI